MRRAIALSALGLGTTSPNPPVGCVILDSDGHIVGEGYHQRKGEPHAEAHALAAAGHLAAGGTAVVTLEPCNHHGRTPPCRQALVDAGVGRVVVAVIDPTSRGEGGAARLRAAGIEVEVGTLADEAHLVLGPWLTALTRGRPEVTWAYHHGPSGPGVLPGPLATAADLRRPYDTILDDDWSVEEATHGAHGPDAYSVPALALTGGVDPALRALYVSGTRRLLLNGGVHLARPFLDAGAVDHVRAVLAAPSSHRPDPAAGPFLPPGFRLEALRPVPGAVVVHLSP